MTWSWLCSLNMKPRLYKTSPVNTLPEPANTRGDRRWMTVPFFKWEPSNLANLAFSAGLLEWKFFLRHLGFIKWREMGDRVKESGEEKGKTPARKDWNHKNPSTIIPWLCALQGLRHASLVSFKSSKVSPHQLNSKNSLGPPQTRDLVVDNYLVVDY